MLMYANLHMLLDDARVQARKSGTQGPTVCQESRRREEREEEEEELGYRKVIHERGGRIQVVSRAQGPNKSSGDASRPYGRRKILTGKNLVGLRSTHGLTAHLR